MSSYRDTMSDHNADRRIIDAFENGGFEPGSFGHVDHLRVAWLFLRSMPLAEAIGRYSGALRRLAGRHGAPEKYNETVTWALLCLMHGRLEGGGEALGWEAFLERNADLLEWKKLLAGYYRPETLASEAARRTFVFPDRCLEVSGVGVRAGGAVPA
jgi:hypothetical protein